METVLPIVHAAANMILLWAFVGLAVGYLYELRRQKSKRDDDPRK